jgi:hypothetical protein
MLQITQSVTINNHFRNRAHDQVQVQLTPWSAREPSLVTPDTSSEVIQDWQEKQPEKGQNLLRRILSDDDASTAREGADLPRTRGIFLPIRLSLNND